MAPKRSACTWLTKRFVAELWPRPKLGAGSAETLNERKTFSSSRLARSILFWTCRAWRVEEGTPIRNGIGWRASSAEVGMTEIKNKSSDKVMALILLRVIISMNCSTGY